MFQCTSWKQFLALRVGRMSSNGVWWPYRFSDLKRLTSELGKPRSLEFVNQKRKKKEREKGNKKKEKEAIYIERLFFRNVQTDSKTYVEIPKT